MKITVFLLVTFLWSWGFWAFPLLFHQGVQMPSWAQGLATGAISPAAWGPLVGAIVAARAFGGPGGLGRLLRRGVQFRFGAPWYLAIFLIFPVIIGIAWIVGSQSSGVPLPLPALNQPIILPIVFVWILLLGGPLQEEFGWRGTLLDPLQARFGALGASLAVGVVWAIWHLPLFYIPGDTPYYDRPFWGTLVTLMLISVIFTWIYNNTGKSIAAMLLLHTMFNFTHYVIPTLNNDAAGLTLFALQGALVVILVVLFGAKSLRRDGRL